MGAAKATILNEQQGPLENENLFLPSSFLEEDRSRLGLSELTKMEAELWEGQASECILRLRCIMKALSAHAALRQKNDSGQSARTRSQIKAQTLRFQRDRVLAIYSEARAALRDLGKLDSMLDRFPALDETELFRKSTRDKRVIGDTHRTDAPFWGLLVSRKDMTAGESQIGNPGGTQASAILCSLIC
jgi:hypothetical protein